METRYTTGRSHLFHETQSSRPQTDMRPPVHSPGHSPYRLLLDITLPAPILEGNRDWLRAARRLNEILLPDSLSTDRQVTLSSYDRLSTALTVAQVCGVQRVSQHYAARLAPQPSPESTRASNRRLAQITEFARLLAGHPTLITSRSRDLLREAGLTEHDIVHLVLITGLVSMQARIVAVSASLTAQPQRLLPGSAPVNALDLELLAHKRWRQDVFPPSRAGHSQNLNIILRQAYILRMLRPLLRPLSWDVPLLGALHAFNSGLITASSDTSPGWPVELIAYRAHGSGSCFNQTLRTHPVSQEFASALRSEESVLAQWLKLNPQYAPWVEALSLLAHTPDRITPDVLAPLNKLDAMTGAEFATLAVAANASGMCRIKMGLGTRS